MFTPGDADPISKLSYTPTSPVVSIQLPTEPITSSLHVLIVQLMAQDALDLGSAASVGQTDAFAMDELNRPLAFKTATSVLIT